MRNSALTSLALVSSVAFSAGDSRAQIRARPNPYEAIAVDPIPGFAFRRYLTWDKFGRRITFYLSRNKRGVPKDRALPLVVCIQGSGSQSLFLRVGEQIASSGSEAVALRDFGKRVRVLVVEKPGVEFLVQPSRPGSAEEGSAEYNREFSLPRWVEAIHAARRAAWTLPGIDRSKLLAIGHSEGAQVACALAAIDASVTHVAALAGGGPSQVHDLLSFARRGVLYDPKASAEERVRMFRADWQKVLDAPDATDRFILGHSHLRWSSFCKTSPIEAILRSKARVFIAQGTADTNSLPESADVLHAELLARGRAVTYERVVGGDHSFSVQGASRDGWRKTLGKAFEWFLQ